MEYFCIWAFFFVLYNNGMLFSKIVISTKLLNYTHTTTNCVLFFLFFHILVITV